jgi:CRISPR-associated protein Csb2
MFTLAIRYLNGWAMAAADGARKEHAEWPPHPDRLFMALAAAWFETGEDTAEGKALRWLETQDPPSIAASDAESRHGKGSQRPTTSYVPVNDARTSRKVPITHRLDKLKDAGLSVLPEYRSRQPRSFPLVVPYNPVVHFIWTTSPTKEHRDALSNLASKVTHVGHSASLVQAWIERSPVEPSWLPAEGITAQRLRVPHPGRLDLLARLCNRETILAHADLSARLKQLKGKEKKRMQETITERFGPSPPRSMRPEATRWIGYTRPDPKPSPEIPGSLFDPRLLMFRLTGKRLSLPATLKLTEALRGSLLASCPEPIPEWFSGHTADQQPTKKPHIAIFPMPFVDDEHADGHIMGLGLAIPKTIDKAEAARCLEKFLFDEVGLPAPHRLFAGQWFECGIELENRERPPKNLQTYTWTRASYIWASATPVVLDRHFSGKDKWQQAAENVKDACERIGLPRPREVILQPVSLVEGVPHARDFPPTLRKKDGGRRFHTHAVILFDEPVSGPVLIGAGRFRGYGLCRPMDQGQGKEHG